MIYEIKITSSAIRGWDGIFDYIVNILGNRQAALDLAKEIEACYKKIKNHPFMYEYCNDVRLKQWGYRKAIIKNYILVYRVDDKNKIVYILRIFYGRQNYIDYL